MYVLGGELEAAEVEHDGYVQFLGKLIPLTSFFVVHVVVAVVEEKFDLIDFMSSEELSDVHGDALYVVNR